MDEENLAKTIYDEVMEEIEEEIVDGLGELIARIIINNKAS